MTPDNIIENLSHYFQVRKELEGGLFLEDGFSQTLKRLSQEWAIRQETLEQFGRRISGCQKCPLGQTRKKFVFGKGHPRAEIVFIGEAPGQEEDLQGLPFVGRAGKLLDEVLTAAGFDLQNIYICNILKCRPPNNRDPQPLEIEQCEPYLWRQLEIIEPKILVALGKIAANTLLKTNTAISQLKKNVHSYRGLPFFLTYHPAFILRNNNFRGELETDLRKIREYHLTGKFPV